MIKFFSKIRKKIVLKGSPGPSAEASAKVGASAEASAKAGRYLKYAIGEIVLVVIGILIALQINNWNQKRLNNNVETQYVQRLLEDLQEDKALIEATLNYSNQVSLHAKNAIAIFENSTEMNYNPVDILVDMYQASQLQEPSSVMSTYKELIASGQINMIRNDSLKTALIRYYELDWATTKMFTLPNNYRENIRGKMPDDFQTEIRTKCGDTYRKLRNSYEIVLPKTCEANINVEEAQNIVNILREDESLKKDLRYLIGNEIAKAGGLNSTKGQLMLLIAQIKNGTND